MSTDAPKRPTIYSIAERCGLSPSAVSRALNHPGRMNPDTEALILETARQMGYTMRRNPRRRSSNTVILMMPKLASPYAVKLIASTQHRLAARGFRTMIIEETDALTADGLSSFLLRSNTSGVILESASIPNQEIQQLAGQVPTVLVNREVPNVTCARIDPTEAAAEAVDRLARLGHTSLTYLHRETTTSISEAIGRTLAQRCAQRNMTFRTLHNCLSSPQAGPGTLDRFLKRPTSAAFAATNSIAAGFVLAAQARGLRIPQDLSVVAYGADRFEGIIQPPLATISEPIADLGRRCAETLIAMLDDPRQSPTTIIEPSTFQPRASIGKADAGKPAPKPLSSEDPMHMHVKEAITLTVLASAFNDVKPIFEQYEHDHPNVTIRMQRSGGDDYDFDRPLTERMALGQEATMAEFRRRFRHGSDVPDLLMTEYRNLPQLNNEGMLLNFSTPLVESTYGPRIRKPYWNAAHRQSGLYGVPCNYGTIVTFYRKDLLDAHGMEAPKTWDELLDDLAALKAADPNILGTWLDTLYSSHYLALLRMNGLEPWSVDDTTDHIDFRLNCRLARQAASRIQEAMDRGVMIAMPFTGTRRNTLLREGRIPILVHANWHANNISRISQVRPGQWKIAMPPAFDDPSDLRGSGIGGGVLCINSRIPAAKRATALHFAFWTQTSPAAIDLLPARTLSASEYFHRKPQISQQTDGFFQQQIYPIIFEAAELPTPPTSYLPFATHVEVSFQQTMTPYFTPGGDSQNHLADWQHQLATNAISRGYTVTVHDDE